MSETIVNIKEKILDMVMSITPHDFLEKQHILDTADWIASGQQIFRVGKPDNPNKHLVSYFVMLDQAKEKILLVDHKKAELWLPTGGHVEIDEDPTETVRRECLEELSVAAKFWSVKPLFLTQTVTVGKTAGHIDVSLWYVIKGNSSIAYDYDQEEFSSIQWFGLDEVPYECSDPHMERFIHKLKKTISGY